MRKELRNLFVLGSAVAVLCWVGVLSNAAKPALASPGKDPGKKEAKAKHWTGDLVDATCTVKALSTVQANPKGAATPGANPGMSHFAGGGAMAAQGQFPSGQSQMPSSGYPSGQQSTPEQYPTATSGPDATQAQMARASIVDKVATQCAAKDSTQSFGLVTGDGQIMKFNQEGNAKASEALKENPVPAGKKVKAKVTGTTEGNSGVQVTSVEIKAKKEKSAPVHSGR